MPLAVDIVNMNLGVKGRADLIRRSTENDLAPSRRRWLYLKAVRFQPARHTVEIGLRYAESLAKNFRSQSAMVVRRLRVLLSFEQSIQRLLLCRIGLQHQYHPVQPCIGRRGPAIELHARQRMTIALPHYSGTVVDDLGDSFGRPRAAVVHLRDGR